MVRGTKICWGGGGVIFPGGPPHLGTRWGDSVTPPSKENPVMYLQHSVVQLSIASCPTTLFPLQ